MENTDSPTPGQAPADPQWVDKKALISALEELIRTHGDRVPRAAVSETVTTFLHYPNLTKMITSPHVQELKTLIDKHRSEYLY